MNQSLVLRLLLVQTYASVQGCHATLAVVGEYALHEAAFA